MLGNVPPLRFFREGEEAFSQAIPSLAKKDIEGKVSDMTDSKEPSWRNLVRSFELPAQAILRQFLGRVPQCEL